MRNSTIDLFFLVLCCGFLACKGPSATSDTNSPTAEKHAASEVIPSDSDDEPPAGGGQPPMDEYRDKKKLADKESAVMETIKSGCDTEADCKVIAFGAKPCGGPWKYLAYSLQGTDETELKALVAEHHNWEKELNAKYGYSSNCMFVDAPAVKCKQGICSAAGQGE